MTAQKAGELLISIIAAVAEMERENIRVQTMAGREQKAREGNGTVDLHHTTHNRKSRFMTSRLNAAAVAPIT